MEIKETLDYKRFDTISGNRQISQVKVDRLTKDISEGLDLTPYAPIIVFEKDDALKIVDGQHRFEACKELGIPIYYVTCNELNLKKIARINSRSDKWKNKDFLDCYSKIGVSDYDVLRSFMRKFKTPYALSVSLLSNGNPHAGSEPMQKYRDGEFKVRYLDESTELLEFAERIFGRYKFWNDRAILRAIQEIRKKGVCDFDLLKEKISAAPNIMEKHTTWKDYALTIEKVYNYRNSKRTAII